MSLAVWKLNVVSSGDRQSTQVTEATATVKDQVIYRGRYMSHWMAQEQARESWRKSRLELCNRSDAVWWRATKVIDVQPPSDIDIQQVLREDL